MTSIKKGVAAVVESVVARTRNARSNILDMQREIAAAGKKARSEIEAIREDIEQEKQRLAIVEQAPASADEVAARVDAFIAEAQRDARSGSFFDVLAAPTGSYTEGNLWRALEFQKPMQMMCVVSPDHVRATLIAEAQQASVARKAPAMAAPLRDKAIAETKLAIRALHAREELCARALDGAGLRVERRPGVPRDIVDASVEHLERWAGE